MLYPEQRDVRASHGVHESLVAPSKLAMSVLVGQAQGAAESVRLNSSSQCRPLRSSLKHDSSSLAGRQNSFIQYTSTLGHGPSQRADHRTRRCSDIHSNASHTPLSVSPILSGHTGFSDSLSTLRRKGSPWHRTQ